MTVKLTASTYDLPPRETLPEEDPVRSFLAGCESGYLVKRGEILTGPRERAIFKTRRGAEKLAINDRGNVVKVYIVEEFPHPDMRD